MIDRLEATLEKYNSLTEELSKPEVLSDVKKMTSLSKEQASLADIIEKYKDYPLCEKRNVLLPVPCNQKMNSYLKEIADLCAIKKNLSTHSARHSYATSVCLANGVSIENVAKMLGHSNISMTKRYARVLDQSILNDMQKVGSNLTVSNI